MRGTCNGCNNQQWSRCGRNPGMSRGCQEMEEQSCGCRGTAQMQNHRECEEREEKPKHCGCGERSQMQNECKREEREEKSKQCGCEERTQMPSHRGCQARGQMSGMTCGNREGQRIENTCKGREMAQMRNQCGSFQNAEMKNNCPCEQRQKCRNPVTCYGEEQPVDDMGIGMAYVPWQRFENLMCPEEGLNCGTIFHDLVMPYYGRPMERGGCNR